jgi:hypothetical protein
VGGSVDATEEGKVSMEEAPVTGNAAVSEADISEVDTRVVYDGDDCPVSSLYVALKSGKTVPGGR